MSSSTFYNRRHRSGFTLTELLIVITIIGLLVGLLTVAGSGVLKTSREFAVNAEIVQLNQATEAFNTKYGFYPPSFEQFKRTVNTGGSPSLAILQAEANQILPFLNKIAPNHRELDLAPTGVPGRRRIDDWWENVGCNLDQSTSLQFWLSGLCQNKQFPLTGGLMASPYIPVGYNAPVLVSGLDFPGGLEREVFYDFDTTRFLPIDINNESVGTTTRPVTQYLMDHGKTNGDLFFVYRDSASYLPLAQPTGWDPDPNARTATATAGLPAPPFSDSSYSAYIAGNHLGLAYHVVNTATLEPTFANPNTFQIITFGLDGDAGVQNLNTSGVTVNGLSGSYVVNPGGFLNPEDRGIMATQLTNSDDNLCNFANGRLDKFKLELDLQ